MSNVLNQDFVPRQGPRELAFVLAWLRVCAVTGQVLTVIVVAHTLDFSIPQGKLFAGIAVLALFGSFALWRVRQPWSLGQGEVVAHLCVDIGTLGYLLYFTGGATNPFITLYIMPIALAATALSARYLSAVVLLAGGAYALLMFFYVPLATMHSHSTPFSLHILGMGINFAITALLVAFFIRRLATKLRARDAAAQRLRERALRDEGILAIATQAAGAAHELNTPLSTMRTLLAELRRDRDADKVLAEDLDLLADQAERCRDILRKLVDVGAAHLNDEAHAVSLEDFVERCSDRFRLLRPDVDLALLVEDDCAPLQLRIPPGLDHAMLALLNNAADSTQTEKGLPVEFSVARKDDAIQFSVRDHGSGFADSARAAAGLRFYSDKRDGMGLGLALATASAERLQGNLEVTAAAGGGTLTCLRMPLRDARDRSNEG
ncbi:MAG: ATP-binding protein [Rudaea sp.]